jgi:hypothetical protein
MMRTIQLAGAIATIGLLVAVVVTATSLTAMEWVAPLATRQRAAIKQLAATDRAETCNPRCRAEQTIRRPWACRSIA